MLNEFENLMNKTMPLIRQHYEEVGRPKTYKINNFAMPDEILKAIGPIPQEGASVDECVDKFRKVFEFSMNTMNPFFMDKLYAGSEPVT